MPLSEFREQFPQYDHMSDEELISRLRDAYFAQEPLEFQRPISTITGKPVLTSSERVQAHMDARRGRIDWLNEGLEKLKNFILQKDASERGRGAAYRQPSAQEIEKDPSVVNRRAMDFLTERATGYPKSDWLKAIAQLGSYMVPGTQGVIEPKKTPLAKGVKKFPFGRMRSKFETKFEAVDRLPALREAITQGPGPLAIQENVKNFVSIYGKNPAHRQLTAMYGDGRVSIEQAAGHYLKNMNRDAAGDSVFDKIFTTEVRRQGEYWLKPNWGFYKGKTAHVATGKPGPTNKKAAGEYLDLDTSIGCVGFCPECYARHGGALQPKVCFAQPMPIKLLGHFGDNPAVIRRIGTSGEPNMNPRIWEAMQGAFKERIWSVYQGGELKAKGVTSVEATEIGKKIAAAEKAGELPTKIKVREYSLEESPLSRFGLNPTLHNQCNVFNMGAGACGECQGCRAWLQREMQAAHKPK